MIQKGFDLDHLKYIYKLIKGEINFDEYLRKRGLYKNDNLSELNYLINENQYLLNEFLSNISVGLRCRAMKGIFNLTNRDIENCSDFGKSVIGYFISDNMLINKDSNVISQRNTSLEMIYDLSIIFDLPYRYLAESYTKFEMIYSFSEYNTPKIVKKNLHELIEEIFIETKNKPIKRKIFGVKIYNNFFDAGEKKFLYTRVDIREKFFTIEMHLENQANINYLELLKLESSIKMSNKIYIRDAFLRDNKKLYILIPFKESERPNVIYLQDGFLWRKVLFNLKEETLNKLKEENINIKF